jgi:hypothetical protein
MLKPHMVRGIFFDFYSVWTPDRIQELLNEASVLGPQESAALTALVNQYYNGEINLVNLTDTFRFKLRRPDIDEAALTLRESDISSVVSDLMRGLHSHFIKLGVLGNLGKMELGMLQLFNTKQPLFEVIMSPLSLGLKQPLLSQEVFVKALQTIGEPPESCLAISGHEDYLAYATSFGMQTIRFAGIARLEQSLGEVLVKDIPSFVGQTKS